MKEFAIHVFATCLLLIIKNICVYFWFVDRWELTWLYQVVLGQLKPGVNLSCRVSKQSLENQVTVIFLCANQCNYKCNTENNPVFPSAIIFCLTLKKRILSSCVFRTNHLHDIALWMRMKMKVYVTVCTCSNFRWHWHPHSYAVTLYGHLCSGWLLQWYKSCSCRRNHHDQ